MPKWKIATYNNTTPWWVTFSADPAVSFYRISAVSYGKTNTTAAAPSVQISNTTEASGVTGTMYYGSFTILGDCQIFDAGIQLRADQNSFVTVTWAAAQTGSLAVAYEIIRK